MHRAVSHSRHRRSNATSVLLPWGWLLVVSIGVGCDSGEPLVGGPGEAVEVTHDEEGDVVAVVDGVAITSERVAQLAKATGLPPPEVVERLIDFELLASEARRRGLHHDREVRLTTRKAMIQRYLEEEFEATHVADDIPDDALRRAYEANIGMFKHPRLYRVAHYLVPAKSRRASKEKRDKAHRLAGIIAREARKASSLDEFKAIGERFEGTDGFKLRFEQLKKPVHERARLERAFINATLKLESVGEVSPPVQTSFGSHVIYVIDVKEPIDRSFEEVRGVVAEKEHPFWLKVQFAELVDRLRLATAVEGYVGEKRRSTGR